MEGYRPEERQVFPYHNGVAQVYGDPIAINRRFYHYLDGNPAHWEEQRWAGIPFEGEMEEDGVTEKQVNMAAEPLRFEAVEKLKAATVLAMPMIPFDPLTGQGATEDQVLAVYDAYLEWMNEQKKSAAKPPTTPPASEDTSQQYLQDASYHTPHPSAFG